MISSRRCSGRAKSSSRNASTPTSLPPASVTKTYVMNVRWTSSRRRSTASATVVSGRKTPAGLSMSRPTLSSSYWRSTRHCSPRPSGAAAMIPLRRSSVGLPRMSAAAAGLSSDSARAALSSVSSARRAAASAGASAFSSSLSATVRGASTRTCSSPDESMRPPECRLDSGGIIAARAARPALFRRGALRNRRRGLSLLAGRVADPAQDLGDRRLFAVHEDADAVDAPGEPGEDDRRAEQERDGEKDLPRRRLGNRRAQEHDERRGEREQREEDREGPARVVHDGRVDQEAGEDEHHGDHRELLRLLVRVEGRGNRRVDARVQEVPEQEEEHEEPEHRQGNARHA